MYKIFNIIITFLLTMMASNNLALGTDRLFFNFSKIVGRHIMKEMPCYISNEQDVRDLITNFNPEGMPRDKIKKLIQDSQHLIDNIKFVPTNTGKYNYLSEITGGQPQSFEKIEISSGLSLASHPYFPELIEDFKADISYLSFLLYEPETPDENEADMLRECIWNKLAITDKKAREYLLYIYKEKKEDSFFKPNYKLVDFWDNYYGLTSPYLENFGKLIIPGYMFSSTLPKGYYPKTKGEWFSVWNNIYGSGQ